MNDYGVLGGALPTALAIVGTIATVNNSLKGSVDIGKK